MAFVNELISEEDKQKIDWSKFIAWPFSKPHRPWKWTIDRERDVFLYLWNNRGTMTQIQDLMYSHYIGKRKLSKLRRVLLARGKKSFGIH